MPKGRFRFRQSNASMALRRFSPSWFGSRIYGWYDSSNARSLTLEGPRVAVMRDIGPRQNNLTQNIPANQPRHGAVLMNGLPTTNFQDVNRRLRSIVGSMPQPFTAAMAFHLDAFANNAVMFGSANTQDGGVDATAAGVRQRYSIPDSFFSMDAGVQLFTPFVLMPLGGPKCRVLCQFNGANSFIRFLGQTVSGNAGTRGMSGMEIGSWNNGSNGALFNFGELVVVQGLLNEAEQLHLDRYLLNKWSANGDGLLEALPD